MSTCLSAALSVKIILDCFVDFGCHHRSSSVFENVMSWLDGCVLSYYSAKLRGRVVFDVNYAFFALPAFVLGRQREEDESYALECSLN